MGSQSRVEAAKGAAANAEKAKAVAEKAKAGAAKAGAGAADEHGLSAAPVAVLKGESQNIKGAKKRSEGLGYASLLFQVPSIAAAAAAVTTAIAHNNDRI